MVKVFQVDMEILTDPKDIRRERRFVTAHDDQLATVAAHFQRHCYQYEIALLGVTEVATIVQHIDRTE